MCVSECLSECVRECARAFVYVRACVHSHRDTFKYSNRILPLPTHKCTHTQIWLYVKCTHVCVYTYVCVYVSVHAYTYIKNTYTFYIHANTEARLHARTHARTHNRSLARTVMGINALSCGPLGVRVCTSSLPLQRPPYNRAHVYPVSFAAVLRWCKTRRWKDARRRTAMKVRGSLPSENMPCPRCPQPASTCRYLCVCVCVRAFSWCKDVSDKSQKRWAQAERGGDQVRKYPRPHSH